jgi:hypothetical protein
MCRTTSSIIDTEGYQRRGIPPTTRGEWVYRSLMAFLRRRHKQHLWIAVDVIGEDNRRWLTDRSERHGKVRPHRVVSSGIAPGIEE